MVIEQHDIGSSVHSIYLVPDFLNQKEQEQLLRSVLSIKGCKKKLIGRRVLQLGGLVAGTKLIPAPLPQWLHPTLHRVAGTGVFPADAPCNHVLVNEYEPDGGIMPHQDGPAYDARVAIVSLGAPAVMRFYPKRNDDDGAAHAHAPCCSVVLPPGSLLVFTGDAYGRCLHGIDSGAHHVLDDTVVNKADAAAWLDKGLDKGHTHAQQHPHVLRRQGARVSLTFRHVMQAASVSWHTPT